MTTTPSAAAFRPATTAACRRLAAAPATAFVLLLAACAGPRGEPLVTGPLAARALPRPVNIERVPTGAIYQPGMAATSLFSGERPPSRVGDTLKVDISESVYASAKVSTDTSRESKLAQKGPGGKAGPALISSILNLDASASGSNGYKGDGKTENESKFTGQLAVTVINLLPNGHLVVAGDRSIALNGNASVLRFSGIVAPKDIRSGNVVASADTVNARIEVVGKGDVDDASSRNWIQRVLADSLAFW